VVIIITAGAGAAAAWWFLGRKPAPPPAVAAPALQVEEPKPGEPPRPAPEAQPVRPVPDAAKPPLEAAKAPEGQPAPAPGPPAGPAAGPAQPPPGSATPGEPAPEASKPAEPATEAAKPVEPVAAAPEGPDEKPPPAEKAAARPAPKSARSLIAQAKRLRDRGKAQQALDLFGQVVELEPRNADAQAGRGWCYLELSQYAPAEASFQAALDLDGKSADALLGLAETFRYEGRRSEAIRYYERYLEAHPDGEDATAAQNAIRSLKE
jgi:tetratricopeptide (TPR) repeat protein